MFLVQIGLTEAFKPETERFLFYRGVGDFSTPLSVRFNSPQELLIQNSGPNSIPFLVMLEVKAGEAAFDVLPVLSSKEKRPSKLLPSKSFMPIPEMVKEVAMTLENALVAQWSLSQRSQIHGGNVGKILADRIWHQNSLYFATTVDG